jgi:tetratricopeptide (TPR) repeat protein
MFLLGHVATNDGTSVPNNVMVERICNNRVRQQVYAGPNGDFSMQLGSRADSFLDASGDGPQRDFPTQRNSPRASNTPDSGIPRRELANCELRASAFGFRSRAVSLIGITPFNSSVDVGSIVVQRAAKVEGTTLDATLYKAPKDARQAYQKGLDAERNGKLPDAHQYFQRAVELYPKFTNAWFRLGVVCQKEHQTDSARTAYAKATAVDTKFLPAYLSLAVLAYDAKNWTDVLALTRHIFDLDPMSTVRFTGYVLDLDPVSSADAYFYNAMANYQLNRLEDAEKSARTVERLDLQPRFPQVRLLLAELFARKNDYPAAILELQTYLELVPRDKDADQIRARLATFEQLNTSSSGSQAPNPN